MFIVALNSMLALFISMLVGFVGFRKNLIDDSAVVAFNKLLLKITVPAMFISAMNIVLEKSMLKNAILSIAGGFIYHLIALLIAFVFVKMFKVKKRAIWLFTLTFANISFLGFPLITDLFGEEALFYTSLINISFFFLVFSIGVLIISSGNKDEFTFKRVFTNYAFIATLFGIVLFLIPYTLPIFLSKSLSMIGNITPPLSMIVVGATLAKTNVANAFKKPELYLISFVKLIVIPAVIFIVASLLVSKELAVIFTILAATPSAVLGVVMSREYNNDYIFTSEVLFMTTTLSVITLPLIAYIIT